MHTAPGKIPGAARNRVNDLVVGQNVHELAATTEAELDFAVGQREQSVVATDAHVATRVELGATLTHNDAAGLHCGAIERLHTQSLGV